MSASLALASYGGETVLGACGWDVEPEYTQQSITSRDAPASVAQNRPAVTVTVHAPGKKGKPRREDGFWRCLQISLQELRFQLRLVFTPATHLAFLDAFQFEESCLPEEIQYVYGPEERMQLAQQLQQRVRYEMMNATQGCSCAKCVGAGLARPRSAETALGLQHSRANSMTVSQKNILFISDEAVEEIEPEDQLQKLGDLRRTSLGRTSFTQRSLARNSLTRSSLKRSDSAPELFQVDELVPAGVDTVVNAEGEMQETSSSDGGLSHDQSTGLFFLTPGPPDTPGTPAQSFIKATELPAPDLVSVSAHSHSTVPPFTTNNTGGTWPDSVFPSAAAKGLSNMELKQQSSVWPTVTQDMWNGLLTVRKKVILQCGDPLLKERLLWEAAVTHALDHPNILKLYTCEVKPLHDDMADCGASSDTLSTAVEVTRIEELHDCTLTQAMNNGIIHSSPYWQLAIVQILLDVAYGLQELHKHNMFYCYLAPSSVALICRGAVSTLPPVYTAKVANLQCSHFVKQQQGASTIPMQPDKYVAPELHARAESAAADVYSLGMLLWELLFLPRSHQPEGAVTDSSQPQQSSEAFMQLLDLSRSCTRSAPQHRPQLEHVVGTLKAIMVTLMYGSS